MRWAENDGQNQGREPDDDRDEAKPPQPPQPPQKGFCCARAGAGRACRGAVRASCFLVSFFGSSVTLLFATSGAGSRATRTGNGSDGSGGPPGGSGAGSSGLWGGAYSAHTP